MRLDYNGGRENVRRGLGKREDGWCFCGQVGGGGDVELEVRATGHAVHLGRISAAMAGTLMKTTAMAMSMAMAMAMAMASASFMVKLFFFFFV